MRVIRFTDRRIAPDRRENLAGYPILERLGLRPVGPQSDPVKAAFVHHDSLSGVPKELVQTRNRSGGPLESALLISVQLPRVGEGAASGLEA